MSDKTKGIIETIQGCIAEIDKEIAAVDRDNIDPKEFVAICRKKHDLHTAIEMVEMIHSVKQVFKIFKNL